MTLAIKGSGHPGTNARSAPDGHSKGKSQTALTDTDSLTVRRKAEDVEEAAHVMQRVRVWVDPADPGGRMPHGYPVSPRNHSALGLPVNPLEQSRQTGLHYQACHADAYMSLFHRLGSFIDAYFC